jgi:hypothetical protein
VGIVPIKDEVYGWWATCNEDFMENDQPEGTRQKLEKLFGDWHSPIPEIMASTGNILKNSLSDRVIMKVHTTNYRNVFIEIAADSPVKAGVIPPKKGEKKSVANLQYEMLSGNPYLYSSDEVLFAVFAIRKEIPKDEWQAQKQEFFSKGQPCFRASPLTKSYGWGIHSNDGGKIALYGAETKEYKRYLSDISVKKITRMMYEE